ncbi:TetR/AcrR family transcriptional regulator [Cohaesibacter celericrescens]|uniref:TetR/AcrR family transcriptional regulator n=1 Tax=Cohaesibacter celericrescens TaxID=2067669 RepID=A0A2N5XUX2_9HYPH|nr:TetR/AcrR family transcriptional regulator [Cohaesibacter celericrescens]PLW78311.1 TetR/AcrR family transcriptional regulator [Cohaesibacter celericrescens]
MTDGRISETKTKVKQTRNAADTRDKILKAARYEFAQHGFSGARTERIVSRAHSNPRMIYHYFGGKADLYVAVLEEALGELRREELKIDVEHLSPIDGLMQLFDFMHKHFEGNRDLVRLLSTENIHKARYLKTSKRVSEMSSPVLQTMAQLLTRGAASGTVRDGIDPLQVYVMMVALNQFHLSNVYTLSVIFEENLDATHWRAERHEAATTMMRAFLQPPSL